MNINDVKKIALSYLSDPDAVEQWLDAPVLALGNRSPRQVIEDGDIERIADILERLRHGMTA